MCVHGFRDLKVYKLAFSLAMEIFKESRKFPFEEKYSLTSQICRSSRSVAVNIAEAYRKRQYEKMFVNRMTDADAEASETQVWLDFAFDCGYLSQRKHTSLMDGYIQIGKMLSTMIKSKEKFKPK